MKMRHLDRNEPLRVAVIGCGSVARAQHIPNIVKSARMVLHTCVDTDQAVLAECRDTFGAAHIRTDFEGAIEDPEVDMICLATTEKLRLPVIARAAKAGKPVYVEKPLATTLEEMREIQARRQCVGHSFLRRSQSARQSRHDRRAADLSRAHEQSSALPMAVAA